MSDQRASVQWRARNGFKKALHRLRYPPPFYKKVGGIGAVKIHADGRRTDYGNVSVAYAKRWGVKTG